MGQWILISIIALCFGLAITIGVLCLLYMNCDDERDKKFEEWKKNMDSKFDEVQEEDK